jgi:hypothetical protein
VRALTGLTILMAGYSTVLMAFHYGGSPAVRHHQVEAGFILFGGLATINFLINRIRSSRSASHAVGEQWRPVVRMGLPVVAVVAGASLLPALHVGLLSDDFVLRSWAAAGTYMPVGYGFARPVALFLWNLVLNVGGGEATLHALNLSFHAVNTALVWTLSREVRLSNDACVLAAVVFFAWPSQVEPVYWAAGIFDVAMTTFVLIGLWIGLLYVRWRSHNLLILLGSGAVALLALLSKEAAISLPVLWMCIALTGMRNRTLAESRRIWRVLGLLLTITLATWLFASPLSFHCLQAYGLHDTS